MILLETEFEKFSYNPFCMKFLSFREIEISHFIIPWSRFNIIVSNGVNDAI
jgi:hypothetical protein